jgi:hypothetical protein
MKTKIIAGVGVNMDNKDKITYEQLMKSALTTREYYQKANAKKLIDKELRANGFKPSKRKSKADKSSVSIETVQEGNSEQ